MGFLNRLLGHPPKSAMDLGRNDSCWCGSGKKYKHCHYESDQKYFASLRSSSCWQST